MLFKLIRQYFQRQSITQELDLTQDYNGTVSLDNTHSASEHSQTRNGFRSSKNTVPVLPPLPSSEGESQSESVPPQKASGSALKQIADSDALERAIGDVDQYYEIQDWHKVVDTCQTVFAIDPTHASTYKTLGNALMRLSQRSEARLAYEQAIAAEPEFAEVYVNLGNLEAQDKQWDEAIAHYQQAIALKPDFAGAYRNLAKVWTQQGNKRLATECLFHAVERAPDSLDWQGYFTLGNQLLDQGQPKQAIYCYRAVLNQEQTQLSEGGAVSQSLRKIMPMLHQRLADALAQTEQGQESVIQQQRSPQSAQSQNPQLVQPSQASQKDQTSQSRQPTPDTNGIVFKPAPGPSTYFSAANASSLFTVDTSSNNTLTPSYSHESADNVDSGDDAGVAGNSLAVSPSAALPLANSLLDLQQLLGERLPLGITAADIPGQDSPSHVVPSEVVAIAPSSFQQAQSLADQGQWGHVIDHLKQELGAVEPDINRRYELLAKACRMDGQVNEAIAYYQKMLVLQPNQAKPFANLGSLYAQQKQWENAIGAYQQSIQIDPEFAGAYRNLARVWQSTGNEEAAADCWVKAYGLEPDWGSAIDHLELGHRLVEQGKIDAAIASFRRAVARDDTLTPAHFQLAELYRQRGSEELAMLSYGKALQSDATRSDINHCNAIYELGRLLAKRGDMERAIACFQKLIQSEAESVRGYSSLRDILVEQNRLDDALICYQRLAKLQPNSSDAHHQLGDIMTKLERWQEAIPAFQRAIELNPLFFWSYNNLGAALNRVERWQEAVDTLKHAIQLNDDFHWTHYSLGEALAELGDIEEALIAYRKAVLLKPDSNVIRSRLNHTIQHQITLLSKELSNSLEQDSRDNPNTIQNLYKAIEIEPHNAQLYLKLADCLIENQKEEEATTFYTIASNLGLEDPQVNIHVGKAFEKIKYYSEAIRSFQRVLEVHPDLKEAEDYVSTLNQIQNRKKLKDEGNNLQLNEQGKRDEAERAESRDQNIIEIKVYPPSNLLLLRSFSHENLILPDFDVQKIDVSESKLHIFPSGKRWNNLCLSSQESNSKADVKNHPSNILSDLEIENDSVSSSLLELDRASLFLPTYFSESEYIDWIFKFIAQFILIDSGGFAFQSIDLLLINNFVPNYVQELMGLLHIPMPSIINISQYSHIHATPLIVPSLELQNSGVSRWACDALRQRFINQNEQSLIQDRPNKIYWKRSRYANEKSNEETVVSTLEEMGVACLDPDSMSLREQISYLSSAKLIISSNLTILSRIMFCKPGTKIVELFTDLECKKDIWILSNACSLEHCHLPMESTEEGIPSAFNKHHNLFWDADNLRTLMKKLLSGLDDTNH